jgi:hypothetical protein
MLRKRNWASGVVSQSLVLAYEFGQLIYGIGMWADRVIQSEFHDNCIKFGLATDDQLQHISKAWTRHAVTEDAWYAIIHGEVIARVP